jgi:putative DNA primase/helicase
VDRRADRIPADLARLRGARFVHASEAEAEGRLAESIVKQVAGGDTVTARHLYGHWFEYRPCFKVVLSVNHRPVVRGGDWGIWRRILLVPFSVVIPPEEQDKRLPEKLRAEASGILTWIVQGASRWFEDGLRIPEAITTASAQYRAEQDPVGRWIEERCEQGEGLWTPNEALHGSYTAWAGENDAPTLERAELGRRLEQKGFPGEKQRHGGPQQRGRRGIALRRQGRESWTTTD